MVYKLHLNKLFEKTRWKEIYMAYIMLTIEMNE